MLPPFGESGCLPPDMHEASWREVASAFGYNDRRARLLRGLRGGLILLRAAGCRRVFVDGSFVCATAEPNDFDACWDGDGVDLDAVHQVFFELALGRTTQKSWFGGEFFPAWFDAAPAAATYLDLFQHARDGTPKGIVLVHLETLE